jgi:lysophospholipid acyltransferase (LPLAT)-like uncharacterized protein
LMAKGTPVIGAFWHGRLLMMPFIYKAGGRKLGFLVSPHRDCQVVGKALERFGFYAIPGSTTRKGFTAFKKMLRAHQDGYDLAITPDGPRGPGGCVQMGVVELARLTGTSVIPVAFGASRKKILKTWDRFLIPYPFSRGVFVWGEPVEVDHDTNREGLEEKRSRLERTLHELTETADRYFDGKK